MRFFLICLSLVGFTSTLPTSAEASFKTGNELYQICTADRKAVTYWQDDAACQFYILGVVDTEEFRVSALEQKALFCLPETATAGQIKDIVVAYFQKNPELRHYPASSRVLFALRQAFPCEDEKAKQ